MNPIVFRGIMALTIVIGTAGFVLAVLLWRELRHTRPGRVAFVLGVALGAFVVQHALLLAAEPSAHLLELNRSVMLLAMLVLVGAVVYARHVRGAGVVAGG
ncbi:MAG: hypothetical protein ABEJ92_10540 [Halobacteriales archaeon]